ncbi:Oidioi.mRNA.OKI2018_I69.XSR.g16915.t1.cds [Oikopleura dioica]|uniref:Oidioi.mRNA.OKI2018_I69.XSR.g16915.t1.cds n=1 Tax=Oikopleura dioica TaxID=34765 RepID=A0ABN7SI39_OIKDI|nr:Oidioi.mRNA.OKI2018_I69.XSR.g16915.t1.cds [Oikopleura dioica]
MKLGFSFLLLSSASANYMFHTNGEQECKATCDLNRICQFWTFDNRLRADGKRRHECHHHHIHASVNLIKNQPDFRCGSMSEPLSQRSHECRFEYSTDLPSIRYLQTTTKGECDKIGTMCRECDGATWYRYHDVEIDGDLESKERIPGHCTINVKQPEE